LNLEGVTLSDEAQAKLFGFDGAGWQAEFASIGEFLGEFGERTPQALKDEQQRIAALLAG
jgi:phosphoenolpyruvate carboxykinase (GTP)